MTVGHDLKRTALQVLVGHVEPLHDHDKLAGELPGAAHGNGDVLHAVGMDVAELNLRGARG